MIVLKKPSTLGRLFLWKFRMTKKLLISWIIFSNFSVLCAAKDTPTFKGLGVGVSVEKFESFIQKEKYERKIGIDNNPEDSVYEFSFQSLGNLDEKEKIVCVETFEKKECFRIDEIRVIAKEGNVIMVAFDSNQTELALDSSAKWAISPIKALYKKFSKKHGLPLKAKEWKDFFEVTDNADATIEPIVRAMEMDSPRVIYWPFDNNIFLLLGWRMNEVDGRVRFRFSVSIADGDEVEDALSVKEEVFE